MKKIKKLLWEEIDKTGWQQRGYGRSGNEVSRMILYELGPTAFAVYFIIQSHRNTETNECFPSVQTIANECSFSKSKDGISPLVFDDGEIQVIVLPCRPGNKELKLLDFIRNNC